MGDRFITIKEVAKRLGVSRMTLDRWQRKGHFPKTYILAPHRVAFKLAEIEQWEASLAQSLRLDLPPDPNKKIGKRKEEQKSDRERSNMTQRRERFPPLQ